MRVLSKIGQNFALVDPLSKIMESWWRRLKELFAPHFCSKRWFTFYLATIGGFVTLSAGV